MMEFRKIDAPKPRVCDVCNRSKPRVLLEHKAGFICPDCAHAIAEATSGLFLCHKCMKPYRDETARDRHEERCGQHDAE